MKQIYIESYYRSGYSRFMQYFDDVVGHPQREAIEKRLEIIEFFGEFGAKATRQAYKKSRSTIYLWKQELKKSGSTLSSLAPGDKTPIRKRKRIIHPFIREFILKYRSDQPGVDKTTIAPVLAAVCQHAGVKPLSESTVGRIIHDLKEKGRLPKLTKITINARFNNLVVREPKPRQKKTRRKGFIPQQPGDLVQMDAVAIFTDGIKRYIFTAIDISTRFTFAYAYKSSSSVHGSDFLGKLLKVVPFVIRRVQTDNGSEFLKHFDEACQEKDLVHFFNYPRHPEANGYLERFNRTIRDQFVNRHIDILDEPDEFHRELMEYLIWYNTEKPHRGIGKVAPLRYYLDNFVSPPQNSIPENADFVKP